MLGSISQSPTNLVQTIESPGADEEDVGGVDLDGLAAGLAGAVLLGHVDHGPLHHLEHALLHAWQVLTRTPGSPWENTEGTVRETMRMAAAGAWKAHTNTNVRGHPSSWVSKIATVGMRCGNLCSSGDQA